MTFLTVLGSRLDTDSLSWHQHVVFPLFSVQHWIAGNRAGHEASVSSWPNCKHGSGKPHGISLIQCTFLCVLQLILAWLQYAIYYPASSIVLGPSNWLFNAYAQRLLHNSASLLAVNESAFFIITALSNGYEVQCLLDWQLLLVTWTNCCEDMRRKVITENIHIEMIKMLLDLPKSATYQEVSFIIIYRATVRYWEGM